MDQILSNITPAGGATALLVALVLLVVGTALRRWEKGAGEVVSGYSGLAAQLRVQAADDRAARVGAESALAREVALRIRIQEYARGLEEDLGRPHRRWDDEVPA